MARPPVLFVSHGSPMIAIEDSPARRFLQALGQDMERPSAILVISAHWETQDFPAVGLADRPATIHDFGRFPPALFAIDYPAPGAPAIAVRTAELLASLGIKVAQNRERGLDHGAWVPLSLMYPEADIPVFQLSLVHGESAAFHHRLGEALVPLRDEGVLILASGSITHNLSEIFSLSPDAPETAWSNAFRVWIAEKLAAGDKNSIIDYRRFAPHALRNHPTEEHLLPLHVALGAAGVHFHAKRLHDSYQYGALGMDTYGFY